MHDSINVLTRSVLPQSFMLQSFPGSPGCSQPSQQSLSSQNHVPVRQRRQPRSPASGTQHHRSPSPPCSYPDFNSFRSSLLSCLFGLLYCLVSGASVLVNNWHNLVGGSYMIQIRAPLVKTTTAQRSVRLGKLRLVGHEFNRKRCGVEFGYRQALGVGNRGLPAIG